MDWLSSRYANGFTGISHLYVYFLQVLTGQTPFDGVQSSALGYHLLQGVRPAKPYNASAIGFSDSLWEITQRCWDGKIGLRPKVGEVVTHLNEVAVSWGKLMPPQAGGAASSSEETSDSEESQEVAARLFKEPDYDPM